MVFHLPRDLSSEGKKQMLRYSCPEFNVVSSARNQCAGEHRPYRLQGVNRVWGHGAAIRGRTSGLHTTRLLKTIISKPNTTMCMPESSCLPYTALACTGGSWPVSSVNQIGPMYLGIRQSSAQFSTREDTRSSTIRQTCQTHQHRETQSRTWIKNFHGGVADTRSHSSQIELYTCLQSPVPRAWMPARDYWRAPRWACTSVTIRGTGSH